MFTVAVCPHLQPSLTPETLVLASSEKLNPASPYEIVGLEDINGIIIGRNVEEDLVRPYAEAA